MHSGLEIAWAAHSSYTGQAERSDGIIKGLLTFHLRSSRCFIIIIFFGGDPVAALEEFLCQKRTETRTVLAAERGGGWAQHVEVAQVQWSEVDGRNIGPSENAAVSGRWAWPLDPSERGKKGWDLGRPLRKD